MNALLANQLLARPTRAKRRLPRQQHPTLIQAAYFVDIKHAIAPMKRTMEAALYPLLPKLIEQVRAEKARHDAGEISRGRNAVESARNHFLGNFRSMDQTARRVADATSDFQKTQLQRQLRAAISVSLPISDKQLGPKIERFTQQNVRLITSIPQQYFSQIEQLVIDAVADGTRWESLATDLQERYGVAESKAKLIARDQVGKLFGDLARVRQEQLGIETYTWRTMNDDRVREEHEVLEGEVFSWDDAPPDGHPGEAVNCRCFAEPNLEAVLDSLDDVAPEDDEQ